MCRASHGNEPDFGAGAGIENALCAKRLINGKTVAIKRENEKSRHFGKEVSLDIFDREEISAGKSRYQIAQQPQFTPRSDLYPKQRGDLTVVNQRYADVSY